VSKLKILDFWAPWCGPCKKIAPVIEEIANEYKNIVIEKINIEDKPGIASTYGVRSIPTLLFFKDEKVVDMRVGTISKDEIKKIIERNSI